MHLALAHEVDVARGLALLLQPVAAQGPALLEGVAQLLHLVGARARARARVRVRVGLGLGLGQGLGLGLGFRGRGRGRVGVTVGVVVGMSVRASVLAGVRDRRRRGLGLGIHGGERRLCTWFSLQPRIQSKPLRSSAT